jgi:peptide/nickel transport system permease protein
VDRSAHSDDVKRRRPGWAVGDVALGLPLAVLLGMTLLAALPGWMTRQNPAHQSLLDRHKPPGHADDAGRTHALGTDHLGRDVWARLVHGARASLTNHPGATLISAGTPRPCRRRPGAVSRAAAVR